jgi:hypothetical protein
VGSSRKITRGSPTEGHRQVEPTLHTARVGGDDLRRGVAQVELLEQRGGAPLARAPFQMLEVRHQQEVLLAGEQPVHGGELAGQADRTADLVGVTVQVVAGDVDVPGVGTDQRGQDVHGGGLAGAVGPEQREDRASATRRSMPSSTTCVPNDLRSPLATITGRDRETLMDSPFLNGVAVAATDTAHGGGSGIRRSFIAVSRAVRAGTTSTADHPCPLAGSSTDRSRGPAVDSSWVAIVTRSISSDDSAPHLERAVATDWPPDSPFCSMGSTSPCTTSS